MSQSKLTLQSSQHKVAGIQEVRDTPVKERGHFMSFHVFSSWTQLYDLLDKLGLQGKGRRTKVLSAVETH